MSLEAIAALLGHKSMRMTMVYAKIANRDDAADKGQIGRQKIFDGLLARLDAQAS
jgi:integrase